MSRNDESLDPDVNFGIFNNNNDAFNCKYYSIDTFKSTMQHFSDYGLSIMCFNIRSFSKNGEEFLGYLHNCGHPFDGIVLTETWAKKLILSVISLAIRRCTAVDLIEQAAE